MARRSLIVSALVLACPLLLAQDGIDTPRPSQAYLQGSGGLDARLHYMAEIDSRLAQRIDQIPKDIANQVTGLERLLDLQIKALAANEIRIEKQLDAISKTLDENGRTFTDLRVMIDDAKISTATINARSEGQNTLWSYLVAGGGVLLAFLSLVLPRLKSR